MTSNTSSGAGEWWSGRRWWWWWGATALQISATIFLSLFLPLSFLLLAKLRGFNGGPGYGSDDGDLFYAFIFLYSNSTILYFLLSFLAVAAFLHVLTGGRVTLIQLLFSRNSHQHQSDHGGRLCLSVAWLLLCTSMMFAELGIEFQSSSPPTGSRRCSPGGWLFAVGLYETMMYWSESVVQALVDDVVAASTAVVIGFITRDGEEIKERRRWTVGKRVGLGLSFGALWWWRLRHHVASMAETAVEDHIVLKVGDFLSLGLYYLTLFTGVIRAFTGAAGMMQLIIRRWTKDVQAAPPVAAAGVENV